MMMRHLLAALCVAAALVAASPHGQRAGGQALVRAIVLSWDGALPAQVRDLLDRGKLPNLARLIEGGAFADAVITAFPSKTAAGHASLWTGAPARITGISGNGIPRTPRSQFTILDTASGFDSTSLRAEPLWMAAARGGRRAVIVQATQGWPFEPYTRDGPFGQGQADRLTLFEGYAGILGREGVVTAQDPPTRAADGWRTSLRARRRRARSCSISARPGCLDCSSMTQRIRRAATTASFSRGREMRRNQSPG